MMLTKHFSIAEFTRSSKAKQLKIDNSLPEELLPNAIYTASQLERVRSNLGYPIYISSGYRSPALNRAIGGSSTGAHPKALAADFTCPEFGSPRDIAKALAVSGIEFDQLILEFDSWVHIGFSREPRHQILTAVKQAGKTIYIPGIV